MRGEERICLGSDGGANPRRYYYRRCSILIPDTAFEGKIPPSTPAMPRLPGKTLMHVNAVQCSAVGPWLALFLFNKYPDRIFINCSSSVLPLNGTSPPVRELAYLHDITRPHCADRRRPTVSVNKPSLLQYSTEYSTAVKSSTPARPMNCTQFLFLHAQTVASTQSISPRIRPRDESSLVRAYLIRSRASNTPPAAVVPTYCQAIITAHIWTTLDFRRHGSSYH